jgi:tripartite-type tricarboxylate transporter receptor subunit TctC
MKSLLARTAAISAPSATQVFFATVLASVLPAAAQPYPQKAVRLILPYAGSTEFAGRWIAAKLSPALGQQVVVDPRLGAGGKIGHELAACAAPDGYTLMLAAPPLVINPHLYPQSKQPGMDALNEFAPVAMLGAIPSVLAVHPSVPARSVQELVALAKKSPGKLTYGSGAPGSPSHLAGELLKSLAGINILLVPYKGATFALVGAMSGEVDVVIPAASAVEPYVKDKRMRALAVLHTRPVAALPGVPLAAEAGMPRLLIVNWFVLAAPAGTPRAVIERLNTEVNKVMQLAETQKQFAVLGGNVAVTAPEQAGAFVREEFERWGRVIREANIRVTE